MRYLKRFNEGIDGNSGQDDKISNFIEKFNEIMGGEFSQGDEPSNIDLLSEIGDLCNELDMSSDDIKEVIDSGVSDINGLLKIIYDETLQDEVENGVGYDGAGKDRKQLVFDALMDMSRNGGKGFSGLMEDLSDDSFDILYNVLAGAGYINEND